jgi:hypothetical protein
VTIVITIPPFATEQIQQFVNLTEILAQGNQETVQRICKTKIVIPEAVVVSTEDSSESEDLKPVQQTGCDRRPIRHYME